MEVAGIALGDRRPIAGATDHLDWAAPPFAFEPLRGAIGRRLSWLEEGRLGRGPGCKDLSFWMAFRRNPAGTRLAEALVRAYHQQLWSVRRSPIRELLSSPGVSG